MRQICLAFLFLADSGLPAAAQVASSDFCSAQLNDAQLLACAKSAAPNSAKSALAYANLGTRTYAQGDMQKAADYYLRSMPGRSVVDIELHVNRADVLAMIGNYELALSEAMIALRMAREGKDRDGPISTEKKWLTLPRLVQLLDCVTPRLHVMKPLRWRSHSRPVPPMISAIAPSCSPSQASWLNRWRLSTRPSSCRRTSPC